MHIKDIIAEIRKIADKNPDTVYSRDIFDSGSGACRYIVDGKGSCIVGRALIKLGADTDIIIKNEGLKADDIILGLGVEIDSTDQTEWINRVQFYQDVDVSWGNAVIKADKLHPLT